MIEPINTDSDVILGFKLSGKLHDEDYRTFVPLVEAAVEAHGKVRIFVQFEDFHGWDMHALWDDIKFATRYCFSIERVAIVGDRTWEEWMAKVCKPFTRAQVRYFDVADVEAAWAWTRAAS